LPDIAYTGQTVLCEGETTSLSPTSGGEWTSSDPDIATINNAGEVLAIGEGTVTFTFENTSTGCVSDVSGQLTVNPVYTVELTGDDSICTGENTFLTPTSGGTWTSSDPDVATISNIGVVTGVSGGTAYFTFESDYNCTSPQSATITVTDYTDVTLSGPATLCEESTATITADVAGGTWSSSNSSIVSIDASTGEITAIAAGNAIIMYNMDPELFINQANHNIEITGKPNANLTGSASLCVGGLSTVTTASNGGIWTSTDDLVAIVSDEGIVAAVSAGQAAFGFPVISIL